MPTIDEMFPSKFLRGGELEDPVTVTIESVQQEEVWNTSNGKEKKWVLRVKGGTKGVIMSKTLAEQISTIIGSEDSKDWIGHKIVLFPIQIKVAGEMKTGIRARAVAEAEEELLL